MKHARNDYNRIQDPAGKIPKDEPVFLIRGQDVSAPATIRFWAESNTLHGGDNAMSMRALEWADIIEKYQKEHGSKASDWPEQNPNMCECGRDEKVFGFDFCQECCDESGALDGIRCAHFTTNCGFDKTVYCGPRCSFYTPETDQMGEIIKST